MRYFSRGKILISGEYAVLYGAKALAVPTKLGQYLQAKALPAGKTLSIKSFLNDRQWFSCAFSLPDFSELHSSDSTVSKYVRELFLACSRMKPGFFNGETGYELVSTLEFDTRWGLGSSSSLISNIAYWLEIDPFSLSWELSSGSGYDIACARADKPLFYRLEGNKPITEEVKFHPSFRNSLYFVYLGNKQDSQYSVKDFRERMQPDKQVIARISALTSTIARSSSLQSFEESITEHEEVLSAYLRQESVKKGRFPGFSGAMKSLGAWGGDMVLVTWEKSEEELRQYFDARGLKLVFRYDDLINS